MLKTALRDEMSTGTVKLTQLRAITGATSTANMDTEVNMFDSSKPKIAEGAERWRLNHRKERRYASCTDRRFDKSFTTSSSISTNTLLFFTFALFTSS